MKPLPNIAESQRLHARARGLVPAGTQTLAKGPTQYVDGVAPKFIARGRGARVWDVDGNEYLDLSMGIGAVSLGYAWPAVAAAVARQLESGMSFSLVHPLEVELAELVREVVPCAASVRYAKAGAEATSAAVRLARAWTGREHVLCCGYHGWHDWYAGLLSRDRGVPAGARALVEPFPYGDLDALRARIGPDTACVILEPMAFQTPAPGFLGGLQELCREHGALLVFDEMWTGFRFALGGAQELFGVVPDLACFSKAVANGMPLALLTGRADVMGLLDEEVFFFSTFGGETLSLAAARATIEELRARDVPRHLAALGERLAAGWEEVLERSGVGGLVGCGGHPSRTLVSFDASAGDPLLMKSFVQQEMIRRGILWGGLHVWCASHTQADVERVLAAYDEILPELALRLRAGDLRQHVHGIPVQPALRPAPPVPPRRSPARAPSPR